MNDATIPPTVTETGPASRRTRRVAESLSRRRKKPFAHALNVSVILGRIAYLHPTKGIRFRRPTIQLMAALIGNGLTPA